jgi:acyl carrier protein
MQIIAEEIGVEVDELLDETDFEELGIDSLMALVIRSRLMEDAQIMFHSGVFIDYPTVRQLRAYIKSGGTLPPAPRVPKVGRSPS